MWSISYMYFHSVVTKLDQLLCDRSVICIFIQLWLKSISCAYFHSVVTKNDQFLCDRSVVRTLFFFIRMLFFRLRLNILWLRSISCLLNGNRQNCSITNLLRALVVKKLQQETWKVDIRSLSKETKFGREIY